MNLNTQKTMNTEITKSGDWSIGRDSQTKLDAHEFAASLIIETTDQAWSNCTQAINKAISASANSI